MHYRRVCLKLVPAVIAFCFLLVSGRVLAAVPALNEKRMVLAAGQEYQLTVKDYKKAITWKSSNAKVASVSEEGLVAAKKPGSTVIRASAGATTLKCTVTVRKGVASDKKLKSGGKVKKQYGKKYYVLADGSMAVGARKIGDNVYAFDQNGALQQP